MVTGQSNFDFYVFLPINTRPALSERLINQTEETMFDIGAKLQSFQKCDESIVNHGQR